MKKTLGGQRLGSGNKMTVDLHGFERSTHDLGYIWRSTMSAGTLVPFLKEVGLPGDTFDIRLNCDIKTHPTVGPLFGSYKVQLDVFSVPIRLYLSALHNNRLGIGRNMSQIKLPKVRIKGPSTVMADGVTLVEDMDNHQINPSCIFSYLGIRGVGTSIADGEGLNFRLFNAVPYLMIFDIYKNYYANKQEVNGYMISSDMVDLSSQTIVSMVVGAVPIPKYPSTGQVSLTTMSSSVTVTWTSTAPDWDTVMFYIVGYGRVAASTLFRTITNGAGTTTLTDRNADYGSSTLYVRYWDWATVSELSNRPPELFAFPLTNIDTMRDTILQTPYNQELIINDIGGPDIGLLPYNRPTRFFVDATREGGLSTAAQYTQEGLLIKTYQSDLFNNWLSTDWIDGPGGINEITAVDTSGGSFNIDSLQLAKKVYDMLNRIAVSGGSYNDWLEAVYDEEVFNRPESPVYVGGLIKELVFQEVVSNSATSADGGQPLGTLAGKGVMGQKHKGGTIVVKVTEPSYLIGIISLTPRLDYSQGNKWDVHLDTMDDFHKPNLDQIGFQELITEQMAWWSSNLRIDVGPPPEVYYETQSAGKQPAWINYMTNVNEVRGNFAIAANEMFMTLNRRYEPSFEGGDTMVIGDLTTYVDPAKFNHIFAQTSLDAQNFWAQISIDMEARRKMSAKVMPNL